jgi:DNA-3-methyladenine glycosylase
MTYPFDPAAPTTTVARELLGATLWRELPDGRRLAGRVVETEAYLGLADAAAHSFHGRRTARVASMYLPAGHAYVYRIYGLHLCLNLVTGDETRPEAVLIRALAPLAGTDLMRLHRFGDAAARARAAFATPAHGDRASSEPALGERALYERALGERALYERALGERALCSGPAKLAQALAIGPELDGHRLDRPPLWLEAGPRVEDERVAVGPRVGLSARVSSRDWPLRFSVAGDPNVSAGPRPVSAAARTPASSSARPRRRRAP